MGSSSFNTETGKRKSVKIVRRSLVNAKLVALVRKRKALGPQGVDKLDLKVGKILRRSAKRVHAKSVDTHPGEIRPTLLTNKQLREAGYEQVAKLSKALGLGR